MSSAAAAVSSDSAAEAADATGPRLLFVDNRCSYFLSHRLPLARAARRAGYDVHVTTLTAGDGDAIRAEGFPYHPVSRAGRSNNPLDEARVLGNLWQLYRRLAPDLAHHITLRGVLYGTLAARAAGVPAVVNGVTGLGYLYTARSLRVRLVRAAVQVVLRLLARHPNQHFTFQNPDDRRVFERAKVMGAAPHTLIRGSGVDTDAFSPAPFVDKKAPVVVFCGRMVWQKGAGTFVEAARQFDAEAARFVLVGDTDPDNPDAIPAEQLRAWEQEETVEWWGYRDDMPSVLARADAVAFPSAYGEGVPKVLIEAAARARPIVTTDVPGCREIVDDRENGLLVPPRDADALAKALRRLLQDEALRERMGQAGRALVEEGFSIGRVVRETMQVYEQVLNARA